MWNSARVYLVGSLLLALESTVKDSGFKKYDQHKLIQLKTCAVGKKKKNTSRARKCYHFYDLW